MAKTGGARPGAGRKAGTLNRRTAEMTAELLGSGKTPIEYLLDIMRDETADLKRRDWAADRAAAFVHPRPAPLHRSVFIDLPPISSADDIPHAISAVVRSVAEGNVAPGEAQSLVAIIDAQRKAIETSELVRRLEALEAQAARN